MEEECSVGNVRRRIALSRYPILHVRPGETNGTAVDVMVTSDDLDPPPQPTLQIQLLRDTSRFPYVFALLAARIDRPGTIARAAPRRTGPLAFFRPVRLATHFHSRQFRRLLLMLRTRNETGTSFLPASLSTDRVFHPFLLGVSPLDSVRVGLCPPLFLLRHFVC